jgi:dihydrofolate reductase
VCLTKNVIYPFAKPTVELRLSREEWFFRFSTARPAHVGMVVAHDKDRIIGDAFNNSIPWSVPSDTAQWLRLSEERVVIAGRKTAEEVLASGKMPGRRMVVISRQAYPSLPNTPAGYLITVPSLGYALSLLPDERVMIIGGGQLFDEAIAKDVVDTLWVSEIAAGVRDRVTTPVYFPRIPHWMYTKTEQLRPGSVIDEFDYLTCVYQRDQSRPKVRHGRTNC